MNYTNQYFAGNNGDALEIRNEATSGLRNPASWLIDWANGGSRNDSGVTVNGYTALTHCPLWQGVNIISGDLGQVPIRLVRDEFSEQRNHVAWQLLRVRPNDLQTPGLWMETMIQWALVWGNGVSLIVRDGSINGQTITDLIPLRPDCLWPELKDFGDSQVLLYHYISPTRAYMDTFFPWEVMHIQGLTGDGVWGYPLWQIARNTIGHGLALEKHGNKQFSNGARPSGVLQHPGKLDADARANLRREWDAVHGGTDNAGKIAILWEDMKFNPVSMTNMDAQWIEARKMSRIDAASLLNLPAYKLNAREDSSSRANLEEQNETYKQMTLTRWATKLDQEFRRKFLTDREWKSDQYRFVFDWDAFMKADVDTSTQVADRLVKATIINPNEARKLLGYEPREGGDEYGNPATAGQQPEDGKASPDNGRPQNRLLSSENAHKELLYDRILHLLDREAHNLTRAAANAKNFIEWLDDFYLDGTFPALANSLMQASVSASRSAGLTVEHTIAVEKYAKHRHAVLLEACSDLKRDELPSAIEQLNTNERESIARGLLATSLGETNGN